MKLAKSKVLKPLENPYAKKLFSEADLAVELGVSPWSIRLWRLRENLPVCSVGGRFYYRIESVNAWLESHETAGAAAEEPEEFGVIRAIRS